MLNIWLFLANSNCGTKNLSFEEMQASKKKWWHKLGFFRDFLGKNWWYLDLVISVWCFPSQLADLGSFLFVTTIKFIVLVNLCLKISFRAWLLQCFFPNQKSCCNSVTEVICFYNEQENWTQTQFKAVYSDMIFQNMS